MLFFLCSWTQAPPHTFNNPAWDAAAEEYMVSKNINPISGVSARHRKKKAEEAAKAAKAQHNRTIFSL